MFTHFLSVFDVRLAGFAFCLALLGVVMSFEGAFLIPGHGAT